jgi:hypothetical protein
MSDDQAEWRAVPGHERYEISSDGQVRRGSRALRGYVNPRGYREVGIDNAIRTVHSLVLLAFVGDRPTGQEVRHLNDVKLDNRLENLAYGTHSENMHDRVRNGGSPQRNRTQCKNGHPFDENNTALFSYQGAVHRRCRACARQWSRNWSATNKQKKNQETK